MSKSRNRRAFYRWHRRLGVVSALFVLLLCVTGILLNHTHGFRLASHYISSPVVLSLYGRKSPSVLSFNLSNFSIISGVGRQVYARSEAIYSCDSNFVSALTVQDGYLIGCETSIVWMNAENRVLDVIDSSFGWQGSIQTLGVCEKGVCFQSGSDIYALDLTALSIEPVSVGYTAALPVELSIELQAEIQGDHQGGGVSWERLVLDIHAGRFMGAAGPWLMDAVALMFIVLSLTGMYLWFMSTYALRKKQKKRGAR